MSEGGPGGEKLREKKRQIKCVNERETESERERYAAFKLLTNSTATEEERSARQKKKRRRWGRRKEYKEKYQHLPDEGTSKSVCCRGPRGQAPTGTAIILYAGNKSTTNPLTDKSEAWG